jgi:GT2 family glycosyltransferase
MNVYYNESGDVDNTELYHKSVLTGDRYQTTTGGLFVVTRHLWEQMRGMRTKYTTGEDLDFGLRIARSGTLLLRRQNLWAMHHTVHYKSFSRMWSDLFHGRNLYARAVLYRNHLFNRHMYARMIKRDPTVVVLILCTLLSLYTHRYNLLILYPFILGIIFGFILKVDTVKEFFNRILYQILRDLMTILGFFFFFPCEKTIAYQKIQ